MTRKILIIIILLIIGTAACSYFGLRNGVYPAVIVNWSPVSQKNVDDYYKSSLNYFAKELFTYGSNPALLEDTATQQEIKRAVIEKLIEDKIVYAEAKKQAGKDLEEIADKKISDALTNKDIQEAVTAILGSDLDYYIEKELRPMAYREIVEGRMLLNNENFGEWLENAKNNSSVFVLLPGYSWDGKGVKITGN